MPAPAWVKPGTDLDFVMDRRPRDLRELLGKSKPWSTLFEDWCAGAGHTAALAVWIEVSRAHRRANRFLNSYKIPAAAAARLDPLIGLAFFDSCGQVRAWLREEKELARREVGPRASGKQVREQRRKNEKQAIAAAQSALWEGAAGGGQLVTERTVAMMEGTLAANTRSIKPRLAELYSSYRNGLWDQGEAVTGRLEAAHSTLGSAEAALRQACHEARARLPMTPIDARAALFPFWSAYLEACTGLGATMLSACEECVRWARKDTARKIEGNFAAAHPSVAAAQFSINLTVTVLGAVIQNLGLVTGVATLNPVLIAATSAAASALTAVCDRVEQLAASKIAAADAKNPTVVLKHVGRDYQRPASGATGERVAEAANFALNAEGQAVAPTLAAVARAMQSDTGAAAQFVPIAGSLWRFGVLTVRFNDLVNPKVLADTPAREALATMVRQAFADLDSTAAPVEVRVIQVDPGDGEAQVVVNGVPGTLAAGRFRPNNRDEALGVVLRAWQRSTGDVHPGFPYADPELPAVKRLSLRVRGELATAENVREAILPPVEEDTGGFLCRATASGLGLGSAVGRDLWTVRFHVSYEGGVTPVTDQQKFEQLTLYSRDRERAEVRTTDKFYASILLDLLTRDPGLENVLALQETRDLPPGRFLVNGDGVLLAPNGTEVVELADLEVAGLRARRLNTEFTSALQQLDAGEYVELTALPSPLPQSYSDRLEPWHAVLALFREAYGLPDAFATFRAVRDGLVALSGSPAWAERFYRLCEVNGLVAAYLRISSLVTTATSVRETLQAGKAPSESQMLILSSFEPDEWDQLLEEGPFGAVRDYAERVMVIQSVLDGLANGVWADIDEYLDDAPPFYAQQLEAWREATDQYRQALAALAHEGAWSFYESFQNALESENGDALLKFVLNDEEPLEALNTVATAVQNLDAAVESLARGEAVAPLVREALATLSAEDWQAAFGLNERYREVHLALAVAQ